MTFVAIARDWVGAVRALQLPSLDTATLSESEVKNDPATLRCAPQFARSDPVVVLEAMLTADQLW